MGYLTYRTLGEFGWIKDHIEREIYKAIYEHGKIRYSPLHKIIVQTKDVTTEKTFDKRLAGMVEKRLIFKQKEVIKGTFVSHYSTTEDIFKAEDKVGANTAKNVAHLDRLFKQVQEKYQQLSVVDQALDISGLFIILFLAKVRLGLVSNYVDTPAIRNNVERLNELGEEIRYYMLRQSQNPLQVLDAMDSMHMYLIGQLTSQIQATLEPAKRKPKVRRKKVNRPNR